jgi:hypothetical protein
MAATDLVSYTGNAGLGLGANADIPATGINTNVIDDTNKTLMLLNHENNINKYKQKIADRDKLYTLLDTDQTQSGDIDPIYEPAYEKARKEHDDAFYDMVQNGGIDNTAAYEKYMQTGTTLKNTVTHLQANTLGLKALKTQQAAEPVKAHQEAIQQHIDAQRAKGADGVVDPYQTALQFDPEPIYAAANNMFGGVSSSTTSSSGTGGASTGLTPTTTTSKTTTTTKDGKQSTSKTQTTSPVKQLLNNKGQEQINGNIVKLKDPQTGYWKTYSVSQQKADFGNVLDNITTQYADPTSAEHQNMEANRNIYEAAPDNVAMPVFQHMIKRLNDSNTDLGLKPGDQGYQDTNAIAQQLGIDPNTGKRVRKDIAMSTPQFNALMAYTHYNGSYAPKTETWMKDIDEADEKKRHNIATESLGWAKNNLALDKWKTQKGELDKENQASKVIYNDLTGAINPTTGTIDVSTLPQSRQFIGGVVFNSKGGKQLGQVYPKMSFYTQEGQPTPKENKPSYAEYLNGSNKDEIKLAAAGKLVRKEDYPTWSKSEGERRGYQVHSRYDVSYYDGKGNEIKPKGDTPLLADYDLPDVDKKEFNIFKKKYGGTINQFLVAKAKNGDYQAHFQGENGVGTPSSIIEGEKLIQSSQRKNTQGIYSDGNDEVIDEGGGGESGTTVNSSGNSGENTQ